MKVAWNRTTVETLEMAFKEALPASRIVCRDEQYKNKAIVMYTLNRYSALLNQVEIQKQNATSEEELIWLGENPKVKQLQKDFRRLFTIWNSIMLSEVFKKPEKKVTLTMSDG